MRQFDFEELDSQLVDSVLQRSRVRAFQLVAVALEQFKPSNASFACRLLKTIKELDQGRQGVIPFLVQDDVGSRHWAVSPVSSGRSHSCFACSLASYKHLRSTTWISRQRCTRPLPTPLHRYPYYSQYCEPSQMDLREFRPVDVPACRAHRLRIPHDRGSMNRGGPLRQPPASCHTISSSWGRARASQGQTERLRGIGPGTEIAEIGGWRDLRRPQRYDTRPSLADPPTQDGLDRAILLDFSAWPLLRW